MTGSGINEDTHEMPLDDALPNSVIIRMRDLPGLAGDWVQHSFSTLSD